MTTFYTQLQARILRDRDTHIHSSQYYHRLYLYVTIPTVVLTTFSSILAFVSTSTFVNETDRQLLSLTVGVLGIIASLVQSVTNTLAYGTRAQSFMSAARQYDQLVVKIIFEIETQDEADFMQMIEKRLLDIRAQCEHYPPPHIMALHMITPYHDGSLLNVGKRGNGPNGADIGIPTTSHRTVIVNSTERSVDKMVK